jgi:hypothetical protein
MERRGDRLVISGTAPRATIKPQPTPDREEHVTPFGLRTAKQNRRVVPRAAKFAPGDWFKKSTSLGYPNNPPLS